MTPRRINQVINVEATDNPRKIVNFNYSENFNRVIELTTENYPRWKGNILYLLTINDLVLYATKEKIKKLRKKDIKEDILNYTEDQFDNTLVYAKNTNENDINNDITAKWMILNTLGEKTQEIVKGNGKTAHQVWKLLEKSFTKSKESRKLELKKKLNELKFEEEQDINIFMADLQNTIEELEKIDEDLSTSTKVGILNRALPENLRFINVFQYNSDWEKCTDYVKNVIPQILLSNLTESNYIKENNNKNIFSAESTYKKNQEKSKRYIKNINKNTKRPNIKCNYCGKRGHFFYNCFKRKRNQLRRRSNTNFKRKNNYNKSNIKNKKVIDNIQRNNYNDIYAECFSQDYNTNESNTIDLIDNKNKSTKSINKELICWTLDSGASINITNRLDKLTNIKYCNEKIFFANNQSIIINKVGTFIGYINEYEFTIEDVYYSPLINKNLISIGNLIKQNYKILFNTNHNKSYVTIYDKYQNKIANIISNANNTFNIWLSTQRIFLHDNNTRNTNDEINYINMKIPDKLNLWHRRFSHFDIKSIKNKLLKTDIKLKCPLCAQSKIKNKPYSKNINTTKHIFELLHLDLVGPLPESIHGNKYFFTILDDYSRYGWVLFLKGKDYTFPAFYKWFNNVKNLYNTRIKYLRSDNGTEFRNNNFKDFCQSYGIIQQFTVPHNPQQNGRAERFNGTLISSAKVMLNDAKLSKHFWEDSVHTSNYIHNRLPHRGINNIIPYERLNKSKVDYSNIRVFGCKVYYFIPKSFRTKFQNNSSPGIFLGYSDNPRAYKILDTSNNKIILSRSVEFFESNPGDFYTTNCCTDHQNFIPNYEIWGNSSSYYYNNSYTKNPINAKPASIFIPENSINKNTVHFNKQGKDQNTNNTSTLNTTNSTNQPKVTSTIKNNNINNNQNNTINTTQSNDNNINTNQTKNNNNHLNTNIHSETNDMNINSIISNQNNKVKGNQTPNNNNTFICNNQVLNKNLREPLDYDDIYNLEDQEEWFNSAENEFGNLRDLKVYEQVNKDEIPEEANIIKSRLIFKYKRNSKGDIVKRKTRLVAKGFTQQHGIDYKDTFAPTLKLDSIRIFTHIAARNNFQIEQIDVNAAYLNAHLKEEIYMEPPKGHPDHKKYIWKLKKAIYGLKQSGMEWNNELNGHLLNIGFKRLTCEPCIYFITDKHNKITCLIAVYVDDILLAGNKAKVDQIKNMIKNKFKIKEIGEVNFIIGIKFVKNKKVIS